MVNHCTWPRRIRTSSKPNALTIKARVHSRIAVKIIEKDVRDHITALASAKLNKSDILRYNKKDMNKGAELIPPSNLSALSRTEGDVLICKRSEFLVDAVTIGIEM